ncbi:transient receptor potential cation channel subfamily V iav isoform X2 [Ptiloglossa arizonensis]|uniref:transient receptor potential cation channel subfamily V iav isoform X2 n=1 Tax=Ptiloglossa arizonensis TaxID=3350558 RepID=UPI003FA16675
MGGVCSCRGRDSQVNAGSILDRVISQASNEDQCLLYRLANYKKGGELIESYNLGGQMEVEKLIREQFGVLMYADGKGQPINRAEYLRWKFRDLEQVVLPIEASLSRFDPLAQWNDHEACWQMQYRGSLGETLLHVLIICDTRVHTRVARILLKCFPRLAIDVVEGEEYLGASALHLAIAYNNNELVQDLVEAGAIISQRAIGSFFLPRDQQRMSPARNTDYEGLAYLGEYPLAWAACCANESVYNLLLDSGADPDEQDSFGNMILHMVVVGDKLDMFGYALRHPKLPARNGIVNAAGLTPLTLACQLGRAEVFREMLELSAREFWRYSNITCSAYPLNALDTLLPDGRTNWNSALFIILNGTKEEHLDMLDGGIIQRLLEEKWKTFARLQFLKRLIILAFHLTSLSLAMYTRPADTNVVLLKWPEEITEVVRTISECTTVIGVLGYILVQLGGEIINIGLPSFLKQLSHEPAKLIFLISNLLILACIPCRLAGNRHAEDAILVVAVPCSWFLLMFFAGAIRLTGPFVTMVYSMITGDMLTFGIIYMVVLFGFCQSFYFLYKGFPGVKSSLYNSYHSTWMALFQITLGDYNYTDLGHTTYPNLAKTVFAIFMVLVPILLLNMLIAMMGNTYAHVIEQSEKEWVKQRVGKVTINELRKRGMTGEELRRIMWGRASFSTPVRTSRSMEVPEMSAVTAGFGDALSTALDMMAFTHDLDLATATEGIPSNIEAKQSRPKTTIDQTKLTFNNREKVSTTVQSSIKSSDEIANKQQNAPSDPNQKLTEAASVRKMNLKNASHLTVTGDFQDPFLDLVIASENTSDHGTLLEIAQRAVASVETPTSAKINLEILEQFTMTKIPVEEQTTVPKKQYFVESSDNDFAGDNLLGTEARLRRIRSANNRFITTRRRSRHGDDDLSSTSSTSAEGNSRYQPLLNDPEGNPSNRQIEGRDGFTETIKSQVKQNGTVDSSRSKARKRRPKTARNRVSPKEIEEPARRRRESIERNKAVSPPTSPTDPLEPWSTRDIKDMNTILAWEENVPDSP